MGLAAEARIARALSSPVAIGGGSTAGAAAAARRLVDEGASALLSFGLAGGLDPAVPPGALVVPNRVTDEHGTSWHTDPCLRAMLSGPPLASVASRMCGETLFASCTIIDKAATKQALWRQFAAVATDMESGAVADADLPPAALTALDGTGRVQLALLARSLLRHPAQLAALLRLARQAGRARQALLKHVAAIGLGTA